MESHTPLTYFDTSLILDIPITVIPLYKPVFVYDKWVFYVPQITFLEDLQMKFERHAVIWSRSYGHQSPDLSY